MVLIHHKTKSDAAVEQKTCISKIQPIFIEIIHNFAALIESETNTNTAIKVKGKAVKN